jgi:hypothetical protein
MNEEEAQVSLKGDYGQGSKLVEAKKKQKK